MSTDRRTKQEKLQATLQHLLDATYAALILTIPVLGLGIKLGVDLRAASGKPVRDNSGAIISPAGDAPLLELIFLQGTTPLLSLLAALFLIFFLQTRSIGQLTFKPLLSLHLFTLTLFLGWLVNFIIWTNCDLQHPADFETLDTRFEGICKQWPVLEWYTYHPSSSDTTSSNNTSLSSWNESPLLLPRASPIQKAHFAFCLCGFLAWLLVGYFAALALKIWNETPEEEELAPFEARRKHHSSFMGNWEFV